MLSSQCVYGVPTPSRHSNASKIIFKGHTPQANIRKPFLHKEVHTKCRLQCHTLESSTENVASTAEIIEPSEVENGLGNKENPKLSPESPLGLSDDHLRMLWDSVNKPLLRLGRDGLRGTHARSLTELLSAHGLVKVLVVGESLEAVNSTGAALADISQALLLQVKGKTVLFGKSGATVPELLEFAKAAVTRRTEQRESREKARGNWEEERGAATSYSADRSDGRPRYGGDGLTRTPERSERRGSTSTRTSTRRSGPSVEKLISGAVTDGPLSRETLKNEWDRIAGAIVEEEKEEFGPKRSKGRAEGSEPRPSRVRSDRAPWRQPEAVAAAGERRSARSSKSADSVSDGRNRQNNWGLGGPSSDTESWSRERQSSGRQERERSESGDRNRWSSRSERGNSRDAEDSKKSSAPWERSGARSAGVGGRGRSEEGGRYRRGVRRDDDAGRDRSTGEQRGRLFSK